MKKVTIIGAVSFVIFITFINFINNNYIINLYENKNMQNNIGVDFEVFGRVQGVFFRKYTQKKAEELLIKGWCMNTKQETVVGRLEGDKKKIEEMKEWLRVTGSPQSLIDEVKFKNEQIIDNINYQNFSIKK